VFIKLFGGIYFGNIKRIGYSFDEEYIGNITKKELMDKIKMSEYN
jgi:hypothetical protein